MKNTGDTSARVELSRPPHLELSTDETNAFDECFRECLKVATLTCQSSGGFILLFDTNKSSQVFWYGAGPEKVSLEEIHSLVFERDTVMHFAGGMLVPFQDFDGRWAGAIGISEAPVHLGPAQEMILKSLAKLVLRQIKSREQVSSFSELAAGITHEINSPLTAIQGSAFRLQRLARSGRVEPQSILEIAGRITDIILRTSQIVRGLTLLSPGSERQIPERTDITRLVQETVILCQEKFQQGGVALCFADRGGPVFVECFPVQISQVILNLVNNAFDAAESSAEKWVRINVSSQEDSVKVSVEDSGPGVPPECLQKIFSPFFTTKNKDKGSGLGLSICRRIMEYHQGSIRYVDDGQKRFVIKIPRSRSH